MLTGLQDIQQTQLWTPNVPSIVTCRSRRFSIQPDFTTTKLLAGFSVSASVSATCIALGLKHSFDIAL